ncbi:hypothetical protein, partial [Pseudoalteromonas sp. S186]|uniref:hypothetical protein n=1 Tax=Pseudoalteromonas sp. S186 TaxID=2066521 RepID=UPI001BB1DF99
MSESSWSHWSHFQFFSFNFNGQSLIAAAAIICLPRPFHVPGGAPHHRRQFPTARVAFPRYLLLPDAMMLPIA